MAGMYGSVSTERSISSGNTTVMVIRAGSAQVRITKWIATCSGTTLDGTPLKLQLWRSGGENEDSVTESITTNRETYTFLASARVSYSQSSDPTLDNRLGEYKIHPTGGGGDTYTDRDGELFIPPNEEIAFYISGAGGSAPAISITVSIEE